MKRIFAGVKIVADEKLIEAVDMLKLDLRQENIRWVNTGNYHITLKFFGNTEDEKIDKICELFEEINPNHHSFKIKVTDTGTFDRKGNPKILWFDTSENESLYTLAKDIDEQLQKLGYSIEKRPFKAHLTIGSIKHIKDKQHFMSTIEKYKNHLILESVIDRFILYESILKPGGPIYTELAYWKLDNEQ